MAIRVGIIGVGWGSIVIAPAFRTVPEFEVVALCSQREERVKKAAENLGIQDTSTNWEEFVTRDDLDLVVVATPTDMHHRQVLAAFAAGKHVLCEKPLALDVAQGREMLDAAEASGKAHAVCFENRYAPERLPVWAMVREGYLGEPYVARFKAAADYWHPTRSPQSEWMYSVEQGGGYLMGMASHDIDYACALLGDPVEVAADVRTTTPRRKRPDGTEFDVTADDTSTVIMRMSSGASVTIATSVVALHYDDRLLEIFGSDGTVVVGSQIMATDAGTTIRATRVSDEALTDVALSTREPRSGAEIPRRRAGVAIRALAIMLEEWLPAFEGKPAPGVPTIRDGFVTQLVIDAARRSSAGEGWVPIQVG